MNKAHTPYTTYEDNKIWDVLNNRPSGRTLADAVKILMDDIPNRPSAGLLARYYVLKNEAKKATFEYKKTEKIVEPKIEIPTQTLDEIIGKIEHIKVEASKILAERDRLIVDLSTAQNTIVYQKKRILELEEDQQAFLRLMDKARSIGKVEVDG